MFLMTHMMILSPRAFDGFSDGDGAKTDYFEHGEPVESHGSSAILAAKMIECGFERNGKY